MPGGQETATAESLARVLAEIDGGGSKLRRLSVRVVFRAGFPVSARRSLRMGASVFTVCSPA